MSATVLNSLAILVLSGTVFYAAVLSRRLERRVEALENKLGGK